MALVLVVDDDPCAFEIEAWACAALNLPIQFRHATTVAEGLEIAKRDRPDAIVTDMCFDHPSLDTRGGERLCNAIRREFTRDQMLLILRSGLVDEGFDKFDFADATIRKGGDARTAVLQLASMLNLSA